MIAGNSPFRSSGVSSSRSSAIGRMVPLAWIVAVIALGGNIVTTGSFGSSGPQPVEEHSFTTVRPASPSPAETLGRVQGPALDVPQEILEMLNQRQRALDKREEAIRSAEARLTSLKGDIEEMLARYEQALKAAETDRQQAKQKRAEAEDAAAKAMTLQVAKMYETMPPEEAAARLEKMPPETALQILRSLKSKSAGAILALVKPDKAAKLTERFLVPPGSAEGKAGR
jgi:flagellar motility protein MotE (MotC chaperone)